MRARGTARPGRRRSTVVPSEPRDAAATTPQAASTSAVAAGSSGRRAKTKAATAATSTRRTGRRSSRLSSVAPRRRGRPCHVDALWRAIRHAPRTASRRRRSGRAAERSVEIPSQASDRLTADGDDQVAAREPCCRRVDRVDPNAGAGPGVAVEADPGPVRRRGRADPDEQQPDHERSRQQRATSRGTGPIASPHSPRPLPAPGTVEVRRHGTPWRASASSLGRRRRRRPRRMNDAARRRPVESKAAHQGRPQETGSVDRDLVAAAQTRGSGGVRRPDPRCGPTGCSRSPNGSSATSIGPRMPSRTRW